MAIKNYTTTIKAEKTITEIQQILAKHKAKAILTEYDNEGNVMALSFKVETKNGDVGIRLPVNTDKVLQVLKNQRKNNSQVKDTKEQAIKTGWRNIKDWIDAQMALIETEMVTIDQIFLPYILNNNGQTLYEAFSNNQLMIGGE
jgi:hypothetical protein